MAGTIAWPNGVDLDPHVLHGIYAAASGQGATVIREFDVITPAKRPASFPQ